MQDESIAEEAIENGDVEPPKVSEPASASKDAPEARAMVSDAATEEQLAETTTKPDNAAPTTDITDVEDQTSLPTDAPTLVGRAKASEEEGQSKLPAQLQSPDAARAQSQTKEVLSETKPVGPVVKIPTAAAGDAPLASQASSTVQKAEGEEPTEIGTTSPRSEDAGSDAEVGAEPSFHSAQEDVADADTSLEAEVELDSANHGADPSATSVVEDPLLKISTIPTAPVTEEVPPPTSTSSDLAEQDAAAPTNTKDTDVKETITADEDTKDEQSTTIPTQDVAEMATSSAQPSADVVKKSGPQQTTSLNPFAKKPKTQRHKEKTLTKKERRKKEQEEKAAQTKAGKAGPVSTPKEPAIPLNVSPEQRQTTATAHEPDASAKPTAGSAKSGAEAGQATGGTASKG